MPTSTSPVGGLTLPIPAGTANSALADPTVTGLLAYLSWSLRNDIDAKLAVMAGMSSSACPAANAFPWDPDTHFVRQSIPALYVWWPGQSRVFEQTLVYSVRERPIHAMFVFDEHVAPSGLLGRAGLLAAVDACFAKAAERGRHASYTPTGHPAGKDILTALTLHRWAYEGAQQGQMAAPIPATSASPGGPPEGNVKRGYPCLIGRFLVHERIAPDAFSDPTDAPRDIRFIIETNESGDMNDTLQVHDGYLPGDDGEGG